MQGYKSTSLQLVVNSDRSSPVSLVLQVIFVQNFKYFSSLQCYGYDGGESGANFNS